MLSDDVRKMEDKLMAYSLVVNVLRKQHITVPDDDFEKMKEFFAKTHLNKVLQYCPFPDSCNQYDTCESVGCNADECSNGYAFRRS